jgi:hypothetical protein
MENTGQIVRSRKTGKSRYTPISNEILQSKTLTPEEKSILVHLLSLPEDWVTYKTVIWQDMNMGRDRFNKHWSSLVDKGYIVSIKYIKPNGQFGGYNHVIYEEPILPNHQVTENQGTVIQSTDNQVTEIQLTGVQFTGDQGVNKVITEQSNYLQSNKKQRNNIIPKEDNFRDEHYEAFSLDTVPQLMLWCFEHNREFNNCTPNGILYDKSYYKLSIEEKQLHLMNLTKELQTN